MGKRFDKEFKIGEVRRLKADYIDSRRMLIKVVDGKGKNDRYNMLSKTLLAELRRNFKPAVRNPTCFHLQLKRRKASGSACTPAARDVPSDK